MLINIEGINHKLESLLIQNSNLSLLIGAGCSFDHPSNLETGFNIMKSIIRLSCIKTEVGNILNLIDEGKLRFEALIENFRNNIDSKLDIIGYFDQSKKPNNHHYLIAKILKNKNYVITVNFDNLIELALLKNDTPKEKIIPVINEFDFLKYYNPEKLTNNGFIPIYKIHGSYRNLISGENTLDSLITTIHALGQRKSKHTIFSIEPYKSFAFKKILENRILVVIGYSGSDDFDVIPTLKKIKNIKCILWVNHETESLTPKITEIKIEKKKSLRLNSLDRVLFELKIANKKLPIFKIDINVSKLVRLILNKRDKQKKHTNFLGLWLKNKFKTIKLHQKIFFTYHIYVNLNNFQKSLELVKKLYSHSLQIKNIELGIKALSMLGIDYFNQGKVFKSKLYSNKALKVMEDFKFKKPLKAKVLNNLGFVYRKMGESDKAEELFKKALDLSIDLNDEESSASYMSNFSDILIEKRDFKAAKKYLRKAIRIDRRSGDLDSMSNHISNMAHLYTEQNMFPKAIDSLNKSLYIERGLKDSRGIIQRINNIGNVYYKKEDFSKARKWYRKAFYLLIRNNYPAEIYECYNNLGTVYLELYDINKAICFHQLALDQLKLIGRENSQEFARIKKLIDDLKNDPLYVP